MKKYIYYTYCNYYGLFEPYSDLTQKQAKELIKGSTALGSGFYLLSTFKDRAKPTLIFIADEKYDEENYDVLYEYFWASGFINDFGFLMDLMNSYKHLLKGVCRMEPEAMEPVITYDFDGLDCDFFEDDKCADLFVLDFWHTGRPYLYPDINKDSYFYINSRNEKHYVRYEFIERYLNA